MASMAIDVTLPVTIPGKPLTQRGRARLRSRRRRTRRVPLEQRAIFKRNGGQLKREGSRSLAFVRACCARSEIEQQLEEMRADEPVAESIPIGYSDCTCQFEQERTLEEEEVIDRVAIAHGIVARERACRLINCPTYFEDLVSSLQLDPEIGVAAEFIGGLEREVYVGYAA